MINNTERLKKIRYNVDNLLFDEVDFSDEAFAEFDEISRGELYLIHSQLKLFLFDATMLDDMEIARKLLPRGTMVDSLFHTMKFSSPNMLMHIPTTEDEFQRFWSALEQMQYLLAEHTGSYGYYLCAIFKAEILYFTGRYRASLSLVEPIARALRLQGDTLQATLAYYTLIRCHLALGMPAEARMGISCVVNWAKEGPLQHEAYSIIRSWLNVTTGWSGDSPRYHIVPDGTIVPVFEDRTVAIQQGICQLCGSEADFGKLAAQFGTTLFNVRELYMKVYQVVVSYQTATQPLSETNLPEVFQIVRDTGMIQTIIDYGKQIVPTLTAALAQGIFDSEWLSEMIERANEFEQYICAFRDED